MSGRGPRGVLIGHANRDEDSGEEGDDRVLYLRCARLRARGECGYIEGKEEGGKDCAGRQTKYMAWNASRVSREISERMHTQRGQG